MDKLTYYFSHDLNARNDEKILNLRILFGMEGYGIYFAILERLAESSEYKCPTKYEAIAFELRVDVHKIESVINDFELFKKTEDNQFFYSESLINRLSNIASIKEKRKEAGAKGAEARWNKKWQKMANASEVDGKAIANASEKIAKERKGKEIKGDEMKKNERKEETAVPDGDLSLKKISLNDSILKIKNFIKPSIPEISDEVGKKNLEKNLLLSPEQIISLSELFFISTKVKTG